MNPNAVETLTWDTDDHGTWTAYLGWNGLAFFALAETGGSALLLDDDEQGILNQNVLGPTPDGWADIGCYLTGMHFRRGASDDGGVLTRYEAGQCDLTLDNTGLEFEPDAPALNINLGTTIVLLARDRAVVEFIAQDPTEAQDPSMPIRAIHEDDTDAILKTEDIAAAMAALAAGAPFRTCAAEAAAGS